MTDDEIRRRLIKRGVEKIKEQQPNAEITPENVFTDYALMFRAILINTVGTSTEEVDAVIEQLLKEISE